MGFLDRIKGDSKRAINALPWRQGGDIVVPQGGAYGGRVFDMSLIPGAYVSVKTAMSIPAFNAGVRAISNAMSRLPVTVSLGENLVDNHPVSRVLSEQANPVFTGMQVRRKMAYSYLLNGAWYAQVVRSNNGEIAEIWNLSAGRCQLLPDGNLKYNQRRGGPTIFPPDQFIAMIDFDDISVDDMLSPMPPLQLHSETLQLAAYAVLFGLQYFKSGGLPRVLLVTAEGAGVGDLQAATNSVNVGLNSGYLVLGIPSGIQPVPIPVDDASVQSLELRRYQVEEIARILNCPPAILQDLTHGTYSNVEQELSQFWNDSISPLADMFQDSFRKVLRPGENLLLDGSSMQRGSTTERAAFYHAGISDEWLVPSEVREMEGRPPFTAEQLAERDDARAASQTADAGINNDNPDDVQSDGSTSDDNPDE